MAERTLRLEWIPAKQLRDNPKNWRRHPKSQKAALRAAIDRVGWAGAVLLNERSGVIIDGHARKEIAGNEPIPVLIGSWSEDEERLILATLDPLAALAQIDKPALEDLVAQTDTDSDVLRDLLAKLAPPVQEPEVQEIATSDVRDRFWIAIRGPLQHQAIVLQRMQEATRDLDGVEVELGTLAVDL